SEPRKSQSSRRGSLRAMSHPSLETFPHGGQRVAALPQRTDAGRCNLEVALGAAAARRNRIAEPGSDVTLVFQPIERPVQRAHGQRPAGTLLDLLTDGHAVRVIAEPEHGEEDDLLKFAEALTA